MSKVEHYVYRILDARGRVLYIGRTMNPEIRIRAHRKNQVWADEIADVQFSGPYTLAEASIEEVTAIHRERPGYNHAEMPERLAAQQVAGELRREEAQEVWALIHLGLSLDEAHVVHDMRRHATSEAMARIRSSSSTAV